MVQNVITLEFNKDISQLMSEFSKKETDQDLLKGISDIQEEHQITNSVDFEQIAQFIDECTELVKTGINQPKKVVKIDLDKMSSGSDVSSSESSDS